MGERRPVVDGLADVEVDLALELLARHYRAAGVWDRAAQVRSLRDGRSRPVPSVDGGGSDVVGWWPVRVVAGELGIGVRAVVKAIDKGRLRGVQRADRSWLVDPMSVAEYSRRSA